MMTLAIGRTVAAPEVWGSISVFPRKRCGLPLAGALGFIQLPL